MLYLIALATAVWGLGDPMAVPWVLLASTMLTRALTAGAAWRGHPLLEGSGYWSRVVLVLFRERALRRSVRESASESESTMATRAG